MVKIGGWVPGDGAPFMLKQYDSCVSLSCCADTSQIRALLTSVMASGAWAAASTDSSTSQGPAAGLDGSSRTCGGGAADVSHWKGPAGGRLCGGGLLTSAAGY